MFIPVTSIPADKLKNARKDKTLALGEVTGHHHSFAPTAAVQIYGSMNEESQFVDVKASSVINHDEHAPLEIPEGIYEVKIGRELDIENEVRRVAD